MVDTPDEQSIVTYVAQFLERFPELEAVCVFSLPSFQNLYIPTGCRQTQRGLRLSFSVVNSDNHKLMVLALPRFNF